MAKNQQAVCSCGAAYDSSGVCTRCGKKRPRSGAYRVLHTVLCVLGALILFFSIGNSAALRHFVSTDALPESLRAARISDAAVPFTGKNVTEYIMSNYVADSNVLQEDVAAAADGLGIPAFLGDKTAAHFALLRGETDTPMQISADEIKAELDRISDSLAATGGIIVDDRDREQIDTSLGGTLRTINSLSTAFGSNPAGRAVQRFSVSMWAYAVELILLGLLLWRWIRIRKNSGTDAAGALKGMGLTCLIPSLIGFLPVVFGGVRTWFTRDGIVGLFGVTKVLRAPYWVITITGISFGLMLIEFAAYGRTRAMYKALNPDNQAGENAKIAPAFEMPAVPEADEDLPEAPAEPVQSAEEAPAKFCIHCGKTLKGSAKFCSYCGTSQTVQTDTDWTADLPDFPVEDTGSTEEQ